MTDQLTDEYLAKRAKLLADLHCEDSDNMNAVHESRGFADATLDALKVHRDGLPYMQHKPECAWHGQYSLAEVSHGHPQRDPCDCGRDQHIAYLKQLLGVSQ